jgi:hypothetical protein
MGLPKYKRQMQDAAVQSHAADGETGRNRNRVADAQLGPHPNTGEPPNVTRIPSKVVHMRQYVKDMAYVNPYTATDIRKTIKQRIYGALKCMDEAKIGTPELRIVKKYLATPWRQIWTNFHAAPVNEMVKSA